VFHSEGEKALYKKKVDGDREKAILAAKDSQQLAAVKVGRAKLKKGTLPKCVAVHITNGRVADDVDRTPPDSIAIRRHNMEAFFGPVLSRGMMSRTHLHRGGVLHAETPAHHASSQAHRSSGPDTGCEIAVEVNV
jgi:hypothetical protein